MEVLTYVPSNVILSVSGYPIEGWNSISITPSFPVFKQIAGIRGKNTRTRIKNTSATIVIDVPQTELLNDVLSMVLVADAANGTGRLEVGLSELTGTSFFTSTTAYITSFPELRYDSEIASRVWTLQCEVSEIHIGNAKSAALGVVGGAVSQLKDTVSKVVDLF